MTLHNNIINQDFLLPYKFAKAYVKEIRIVIVMNGEKILILLVAWLILLNQKKALLKIHLKV